MLYKKEIRKTKKIRKKIRKTEKIKAKT